MPVCVTRTLLSINRGYQSLGLRQYRSPASMPKSPSMSGLASLRYQPITGNASVAKTPKLAQRCSVACLPDPSSPYKPLDDDAKSLFPLVEHCELPSISPDLLKAILTGKREFTKNEVIIVDTRHKFEFDGGHIIGALNLNGPNCIEEFYTLNLKKGKRVAIIFHCEFSSARAPKLYRHMRNIDRQRHIEAYPELGFPHMYILHGGYKAFYDLHSELCEPRNYVRMADPLHAENLRASNRILKNSWIARSQNEKLSRIRTQEDVLADVSNISSRKDVTTIRSCSACLSFGP